MSQDFPGCRTVIAPNGGIPVAGTMRLIVIIVIHIRVNDALRCFGRNRRADLLREGFAERPVPALNFAFVMQSFA